MPSLGLALIAKNEINHIDRLIQSCGDVFDEIHLTDTGSTDGTIERAKELGLSVHHFDWVDDFGAARNASFDPVKTDYIAWLDLDDALQDIPRVKLFKQDVMSLADYWVSPYQYASDAQGNPTCTFIRERIIKNGLGLKWKYFLHEGIVTIPNIKAQMTQAFVVKHMRSEADVIKDKSRNLNIFRANESKRPLDARMRYYYGKELFEAQQPLEAIKKLESAMIDPSLEIHDRILCMQYACYAYIQNNALQKAIELAQQGILLSPNRAEFHNIIGDCYLKMNRIVDAKPFFGAAKMCEFQPGHGVNVAIFNHEGSYKEYPRNQIARILFNMGKPVEAEKELTETLELMPNAESKSLLDEVRKIKALTVDYKLAQPCDDIVFTTAPQTAYEFDPGKMKTTMQGGSETALIEMARQIKDVSGKPVKVFNMRETAEVFDGVEYIPVTQLGEYITRHKPALHIAWRHSHKITDAPTYVWSHDLQTPGVEQIDNYNKVLCLTPFHARYMSATQGVPLEKIHLTRNGINPDDFPPFSHSEKDPYLFVFSSSPDRGLDRAMLVLDKVREKYPELTLDVRYGIEHLPKYGHQALHDKLKSMFAERPWVKYHGASSKKDLYAAFRRASYCIQPSDWVETSMISAKERLFCGVYQIIRRIAGVVDTLADAETSNMCTMVNSDCITPEQYQVYIDATLKAMDEKAYLRIKDVDPQAWSWRGVANQWVSELLSPQC